MPLCKAYLYKSIVLCKRLFPNTLYSERNALFSPMLFSDITHCRSSTLMAMFNSVVLQYVPLSPITASFTNSPGEASCVSSIKQRSKISRPYKKVIPWYCAIHLFYNEMTWSKINHTLIFIFKVGWFVPKWNALIKNLRAFYKCIAPMYI